MHLKMFLLALTLANLYTLANSMPNLDTSLELNSLQCFSEGRFADPTDCGRYYDCVPNDNGVLVALQKSCFGNAFHSTLKACVPKERVQGCITYSTRSLNVADPKLQQLCTNNKNQMVCSDCKTLIICVDGVPYTDPCRTGTVCSRKSSFGINAVCYPDSSIDCTCKKEDIFKQDHYDPTKFLSCDPEGRDSAIHTCPDGLIFYEKHGSCCTKNESSCTTYSVTSAVKDNCNRYYTNILTPVGSVQKEFTCKKNTMFNEDTGKCEDPCTWYSGNFICEAEGRFADQSNCSKYFECSEDRLNSNSFTYIERDCPIGYEWNQNALNGSGHCIANGSSEKKCVPLKKKPYKCQIPNECTVDCGKVAPPVNGFMNETGTLFGESIMFGCDAGYDLDGANDAKCLASGNWSEEVPQCKIKDCGKVEQPVNGFMNETGTLFGESIMFGCDVGYGLDGAKDAKCLATGKWSQDVPQCKIKDCGEVDSPVNGFLYETGTLFGDTMIFVCDSGYEVVGTKVAKCLSNGNWSQEVPHCKIKCGQVDPPINGFLNKTGTLLGDSIIFECDAGYYLDGENDAKCLATGKWSQGVPQCKINCDTLGGQLIGVQCLYFSTDTDGKKNWNDAARACTNKGGEIAGPIADHQAVIDYLKNNGNWQGWVGGSDAAVEGIWRRINGQELDGNLPWYPGQPGGGQSQDCLWLKYDGYHDQDCSSKYHYICELGGVAKQNIRSGVKTPAADNITSNKTPAADNMTSNKTPAADNTIRYTNIPECVSPWIYAGKSTGCLLVMEQSMDWHSAQAYCNSMDGHLPVFDRKSKHLDMMDYFKSSGYLNTRFWLGATDHTGSWLWLNGMPVTDGWKYTQSKVDQEEDMCLYTYTSGLYDPMLSYCTHAVPNIICQKQEM